MLWSWSTMGKWMASPPVAPLFALVVVIASFSNVACMISLNVACMISLRPFFVVGWMIGFVARAAGNNGGSAFVVSLCLASSLSAFSVVVASICTAQDVLGTFVSGAIVDGVSVARAMLARSTMTANICFVVCCVRAARVAAIRSGSNVLLAQNPIESTLRPPPSGRDVWSARTTTCAPIQEVEYICESDFSF